MAYHCQVLGRRNEGLQRLTPLQFSYKIGVAIRSC